MELKLPRMAPAFEWQHEMSRYIHLHLTALLEKACDQLCQEGQVIQLDKVVIDLGTLRLQDLRSGACNDIIFTRLLEQLQKCIPAMLKMNNISHYSSTASASLSIARQWLFYMEKGYLPWNTLKVDQHWYNQVLEAFATDYHMTAILREQLLHRPVVLKRVISDHPLSFLVKLIEVLTATSQSNLLPVIYELSILAVANKTIPEGETFRTSSQTASVARRNHVWELAITMAAGKHGKGLSPSGIATAYIRQYLSANKSISLTAIAFQQLPFCAPIIKALKEDQVKETHAPNAAPGDATTYPYVEDSEEIPADGIFLIHAGLVLLNPFLVNFFKKNNLLKNNAFIDISAHERALYLLHYLATGETETPEHALVVPKLLCGWPLGKNLAQEIVLTTEECQWADELLEVAVEHWEKLQHTSNDALRVSFLQRPGKLFTHQDQTWLQVEQQPLDILLDYLPWSISHIKLPWMKSILRVEWR